jgi:hypothetical protein
MAEVLAGAGLKSQRAVTAQVQAWHRIFAEHRPDLVVTDYAPGAILAARGRIRTVATGNGYTVPPERLRRFPRFHELAPPEYDETATLSAVNEALGEAGIAPLKRLATALTGDEQCVCTLPFLDPYAAEREGPLLGPLLHASVDRRDNNSEGIFCYLRNAPRSNRLEELVGAVAGLAAPVTAFLPDVSDVRKDDLRQRGVTVLEGIASLTLELKRAKLLIHSGGHGMASAAALAGVPQVVVRFDVEKYLTARALVARGVAWELDYFTVEREELRDVIRVAFDDRAMAAEALRVADEHESYRVRNVASEIADVCEGTAPASRTAGESERNVTVESGSRQKLAEATSQEEGVKAKLDCYALHKHVPRLAPARVQRAWMDEFPDRHIYRCLPLAIANSFGWDMLCPVPIEIEWNGGPAIADLTVRALKPLPGGRPLEHFCKSHFSRGTVTFHTDYIFRTEPGWALMASGPFNTAKDNAVPLTGIVETDWLPYTFTMNWKLLRAGLATFEEDEPFCSIVPIQVQPVLECQPNVRWLAENPELNRKHEQFRASRDDFYAKKKAGHSEVRDQAWQRHYFVGRFPDGTKVEEHLNRLRLKEPDDLRSEEPPQLKVETGPMTALWADDSPMHEIVPGQSAENEAGRARLLPDGELGDRSETYVVRSAPDAEGCDFLVVEDLLDADQCATIAKTFRELEGLLFKSDKIDPYWNNRFLWHKDIARERPETGAIMKAAQQRGLGLLQDFYRLKAPVYSDILQIVRWQPGMFMRPHADNANPDGSPHGMPYRDFAAIAYVNDDYEGGELYFTALNIVVKPKRGMFVAFTGGFHHEHAVLRVKSGTRLTMPSFMTFDRTRADPTLLAGSEMSEG